MDTQTAPGPAAASGPKFRRMVFFCAVIVSLLYASLTLLPWQPAFVSVAWIDPSWKLALNALFAVRAQFGAHIAFTYGPLGFLNTFVYYPKTYALMLLFWGAFAAAFTAGLWVFARRLGLRPWLALVWIFVALTLLAAPFAGVNDPMLISFATLFLAYRFAVDDDNASRTGLLLAAALAAISLIKFSFLVPAAIVVGLATVDDLLRLRRLPAALVVYAVTAVALWLLCGQSLAAVPIFLERSWVVARGYGAMGRAPRRFNMLELGLYALAAVLLLLTAVAVFWRRLKWWAILPVSGMIGLTMLAFKAGFVRHDGHAIISATSMCVWAVLFLPLLLIRPSPKTVLSQPRAAGDASPVFIITARVNSPAPAQRIDGAGLIAGALRWALAVLLIAAPARLWSLVQTHYYNGPAAPFVSTFSTFLPGQIAAAAGVFTGNVANRRAYAAANATIRRTHPLPVIHGPTDVYPYQIATLLAYHEQYDPRPVIQSYSVYTPRLCRLNARFLTGPRAPENLLFTVQTIDNRYPNFDDGYSWPQILVRYRIISTKYSYIVMKKRLHPRAFSLTPISTVHAGLGQTIPVPSVTAGPVWARIMLQPSPLGRLVALAFRPPILKMAATFTGRGGFSYRMIPGETAAGFLLSPMISHKQQFAALDSPHWRLLLARRAVTSIRIHLKHQNSALDKASVKQPFTVAFYALKFPRQRRIPDAAIRRFMLLATLKRHILHFTYPVVIMRHHGHHILFSHAHCIMWLRPPVKERVLFASYGILPGAYTGKIKSLGVLFKLEWQSGGKKKVLWQNFLNPAKALKDRGIHSALINIPAGRGKLLFVTSRGATADHNNDWAYWTGLKFTKSSGRRPGPRAAGAR